MVAELNYSTISHVLESWEALRRIDNYEEKAGLLLFQKFFALCPQGKVLFGFPLDIDSNSPEVLKSKRFLMHASYLIQMLDTALNMLGPDIELLTEILTELGEKHVRFGVKPEYFPLMEKALFYALENTIKERFDDAARSAWTETYRALSGDMIAAGKK